MILMLRTCKSILQNEIKEKYIEEKFEYWRNFSFFLLIIKMLRSLAF